MGFDVLWGVCVRHRENQPSLVHALLAIIIDAILVRFPYFYLKCCIWRVCVYFGQTEQKLAVAHAIASTHTLNRYNVHCNPATLGQHCEPMMLNRNVCVCDHKHETLTAWIGDSIGYVSNIIAALCKYSSCVDALFALLHLFVLVPLLRTNRLPQFAVHRVASTTCGGQGITNATKTV